MVTIQFFPSSELLSFYLSGFREAVESETGSTLDEVVMLLATYFRVADRYLGIGADNETRRRSVKLPFVLFDTETYEAEYYVLVFNEIRRYAESAEVLEQMEFEEFLTLHNRLIKLAPSPLYRFCFDRHMPTFIINLLTPILNRFPFIQLVDALSICEPVLSLEESSPGTFLIVAPFEVSYENYIRAARPSTNLQEPMVNVQLPLVEYQLITEFNTYLVFHLFRTPMSYDTVVSKSKCSDVRRFTGYEYYNYLTYASKGKNIGVLSFVALLDADYFNEVPDLSNYSTNSLEIWFSGGASKGTDTVTGAAPAPLTTPTNACTFYTCCCGRCRFEFNNEKYQSMTMKQIRQRQRQRRILQLKELGSVDSFAIKFGKHSIKVHEAALRVANYELTEQNEHVQKFKRGIFTRSDALIYEKEYPHRAQFDFVIFSNNYKEYAQSNFVDNHTDAIIKAEIMRLGLQTEYARKIEDADGRKHDLADLLRGLGTRRFGEVNEPENDYRREIRAFPMLTEVEKMFARSCGMRNELFLQLKTYVLRRIQLANYCELSVIDLSHYIPFSLQKIRQLLELLRQEGHVPLYQRRVTAGPLTIPRRPETVEGQVVRTGDERLLELEGVGVYETIYNVFRTGVDHEKVQKLLQADIVLAKTGQICDRTIAYYMAKYE